MMLMKRFVMLGAMVLWIVISSGMNINAASVADTKFQTGFHFDWWASDDHDKGMQLYVPLIADSQYKDFSFKLLGAYAYTKVDLSDTPSASLSHFTDTKLNISYVIENRLPFDMLLGLGFNLPTGYTDLKDKDIVLIVPPELMSITTYGEGFNINPMVVFSKQWEVWAAGVGLGYNRRGQYDFSSVLTSYNPGDIFNINAELRHNFTPEVTGRVFGEYIAYTKDKVNGMDFFQEGAVTVVGLGAKYAQPAWDLGFTLKGIFRGKTEFQQGGGAIVAAEDHNSHGNEWIGDVSYNYFMNEATTLNAGLQLLMIEKNDYPSSDSAFFIGKRQKTTLACGLTRALRPDVKFVLDLKAFLMNDEKNVYHPEDDLKYKGFSIGSALAFSF
jgi:hypothetical protein